MPPPLTEKKRERDPLAAWSFGLSLAGLFLAGPLAAVPAVVCGHAAGRRARGRGKTKPGLAVAGTVVGYSSFLVHALLLAVFLPITPLYERMKARLVKPNHVFVLAVTEESGPDALDGVERALAARLKRAAVSHEILRLPDGRIEVRVGVGLGLSIEGARDLLTQRGVLQFRLVHPDSDELVEKALAAGNAPPGYEAVNEDERWLLRRTGGHGEGEAARKELRCFAAPDELHETMLKRRFREGKPLLYEPILVNRRTLLSGERVADAKGEFNPMGRRYVSLRFDRRGARRLAEITTDYAPAGPKNPDTVEGRRLAIVIDGEVWSAPAIRLPIPGGRAIIEGAFTDEEADGLARILGAPPLPVAVRLVEERPLG